MADTTLLQCYNKGCGKKFADAENNQGACSYHPGPPYFHDAYKIWNCCQKKSTDFGTWLNYPGCTLGKHSSEKPADIVKIAAVKEIRPEKEEDVIVWKGLNKSAKYERKEAEEEQKQRVEQDLKVETTAGAQNAIEKFISEASVERENSEVKSGTPCRNSGCEKTYDGPDTNSTQCQYHSGAAIFHEGMKYWSCCNRKTSNFSAFLEQEGCTRGEHKWRQNEIVSKVREDWFSSNGYVTLNVYCRGALPEKLKITSDGNVLSATLVHGFGAKETSLNYDLWDEVIPDESRVVVGERKVEIVLKQKHSTGWPRLQFDPEFDKNKEIEN